MPYKTKTEHLKRLPGYDVNGNARHVIHWLACAPWDGYSYAETVKLMNTIGGRKHNTKYFGGGIVFQGDTREIVGHISRVKKEAAQACDMLPPCRKHYDAERVLLDGVYDCDGLSDKARAAHALARFKREYGHEIKRVGINRALQEWLAGLALSIPYTFNDIITLAGAKNATEKRQNEIVERYFPYMAMRLQGLWQYFKLDGRD